MNMVKLWMEYLGMSPSELARKAGVTTGGINDVLKPDVQTRVATLKKYAQAMGVSYEEFTQGPPRKSAPTGINLSTERENQLTENEMKGKIVEIVLQLEGQDLVEVFRWVDGFFRGSRRGVREADKRA